MSPEEEDACIEELREMVRAGRPPEIVQARCRQLAQGYDPVVQKGTWVYANYLRRMRSGNRLSAAFSEGYWQAWQDFLLCAAQGGGRPMVLPRASRGPRRLFLGWHFPEYPLWLRTAGAENILILVTRRPAWMEAIVGRDALFNFREGGLSSAIPRAFRTGRSVFAMMDHCYPDSSQLTAEFLGLPAGTPTGLLKLAQRFDYESQIVSEQDGQLSVLDSFVPSDYDLVTIVRRVNAAIGKEILRNPPRWLLWALVGERWAIGDRASGRAHGDRQVDRDHP